MTDTPDGDPPLTDCPPWCQKPAGHDWEDEWANGLIRYHEWRQQVGDCKYHQIGVDEIEQHTADGTARMREVLLDAESPTQWPVDVLAEAIRIASTGLTDEHLREVR
jgi:hypothetical protein